MVPVVAKSTLAANSALANALPKSLSMPITSPVERISGPSKVSAPGNLAKGNTASLTATCLGINSSVTPNSVKVLPDITNEAIFAKGRPVALET